MELLSNVSAKQLIHYKDYNSIMQLINNINN